MELECSEMDNFYKEKKQWAVIDLRDTCFQNMIYTSTPSISMVVLTTKILIYNTEKCF